MSLDAFESEELAPFLKYEFEPAHAPTNFTRWFTATKNYNIEHNDGCATQATTSPRIMVPICVDYLRCYDHKLFEYYMFKLNMYNICRHYHGNISQKILAIP